MTETREEVHGLADTMRALFTPPDYVPGCLVKSVADKDDYATNNGWVEAVVGQHGQQRVRYYGDPAGLVADTSYIDVEYFPAYRLYRVFGASEGGTASAGGVKVSDVWESDFGAVALAADAAGKITIKSKTSIDQNGKINVTDGVTSAPATTGMITTASPSGTVPWSLLQGAADTASPTLALFETNSGVLGQIAGLSIGGTSTFFVGGNTGKQLGLSANGATGTPHVLIDTSGGVSITNDLIHSGDADTKISFTDDDIEITAGGLSMLKLTEAGQDLITFGPGSGDVDIDFNGDMFLLGSNGFLGLNNAAPAHPIHIINGTPGREGPQVRVGASSAGYFGLYATADNIGGTMAGASLDDTGFIARTATPCFFTQVGTDGSVRIFTDTGKTVGVGFTPTERMRVTGAGLIGINGVTAPSAELDIGAGAIEISEMTAPGAGAVNTARIYAVDNGAGKTQLVVIFNTGAAQVLATQP
jgi:hypothetical protein